MKCGVLSKTTLMGAVVGILSPMLTPIAQTTKIHLYRGLVNDDWHWSRKRGVCDER